MRKVYWRPRAVSRTALVLIAGYSLVGLILVEVYKVEAERPYIKEKLAATDLGLQAMDEIYYEREELGPEIDPTTDPTESGLIGLAMSPVTSVSGQLVAKQTSINPNFAAVIVDMLKRCDVNEGDVVAAGVSGSFPCAEYRRLRGDGDTKSASHCDCQRFRITMGSERAGLVVDRHGAGAGGNRHLFHSMRGCIHRRL